MNKLLPKLAFVLLLAMNMCYIQAQTCDAWTKEKASKWFTGAEWLDGLKLKPHETVNQVEFAVQYHKNKVVWDKAFNYLKSTDLANVAPGKYPLMGDSLFVSVSEYTPKEMTETKWEAHKKYADIQYVAKGKEKIGIAQLSEGTVVDPYNETKDVGFFSCSGGQFYEAQPGTFFIFFPSDLHRPNNKTEGSTTVKKIVVKVMVN